MSPDSPFAVLADSSRVDSSVESLKVVSAAFNKCSARYSVSRPDLEDMMYTAIDAGYPRSAYTAATLRALADLIESDVPYPRDPEPVRTPGEQAADQIDQIMHSLFG